MRKAHLLRPVKGSELPTRHIIVDTETRAEPRLDGSEWHTLWFGVAEYCRVRSWEPMQVDRSDPYLFYDAEDFWAWVASHAHDGTRTWVWAHNWSYDGGILAPEVHLPARGWRLHRYINDRGVVIIDWRRGRRTIRLCDSGNFFRQPLSELGRSVGISKLEMPDQDAPMEEWVEYCQRDVAIVRETVLSLCRFVRIHDLGPFRPTAPSLALSAYRHRWMSERVYIHDREDIIWLEREAYHGGRCECYRIGRVDGPLYLLDVNGMYPAQMLHHVYPCRVRGRFHGVGALAGYLRHPDRAVVAWVRLHTDTPLYPVRWGGKLIWPIGEYETTLTTPHLRVALERGHVQEVMEGAWYDARPLFRDFVHYWWRLREDYQRRGDPVGRTFCKLMLNSLSGKWGQRGEVWEIAGPAIDGEPLEGYEVERMGDPPRWYKVRGGMKLYLSAEPESYDSYPAIVAHITAYGHMCLWGLMEQAGRDHVYYVDTDSLLVDAVGYSRLEGLLDESAIGRLKCEGTYPHAVLYGPKDYVLGGKVRHKGVRDSAVELSSGVYQQDQFAGWDAQLGQDVHGGILVQPILKRLRRRYDKGIVSADGAVSPLRLPLEPLLQS